MNSSTVQSLLPNYIPHKMWCHFLSLAEKIFERAYHIRNMGSWYELTNSVIYNYCMLLAPEGCQHFIIAQILSTVNGFMTQGPLLHLEEGASHRFYSSVKSIETTGNRCHANSSGQADHPIFLEVHHQTVSCSPFLNNLSFNFI